MERFLLLFAVLVATINISPIENEAHAGTFTTTLEEVTTGPYNRAFEVDITFSKAVSAVGPADVDLGGTANANDDVTVRVANVGTTPTKTWRTTIIPTRSGTLTIEIGGNSIQQGGDSNSASNQLSVTIDVDPPTVVKFSNVPTTPAVNPLKGIEWTVHFSEDVTFDSFVDRFGWQWTISGSGKVHKISTKPPSIRTPGYPSWPGTVSVMVRENRARDAAGNGNIRRELTILGLDADRPTVDIFQTPWEENWLQIPWDENNRGVYPIGFDFQDVTENVDTFPPDHDIDANDIILGGTATATVTKIQEYTDEEEGEYLWYAWVTPTTEGTVTFQVKANVVYDRAENGNFASRVIEYSVDPVPPTVTLTVPEAPQAGAFDITVTFNEEVDGFSVADDLAVPAGVIPSLKNTVTPKKKFIVTIVPLIVQEKDITIQVKANAVTDAVGNSNAASAVTTVSVDNIRPKVTISPPPTTAQKTPFDLTFTFSEVVNGFVVADDLAVTGPATASLKATVTPKKKFTVTITPRANQEGDVIVRLKANAVTDESGNKNTASDLGSDVTNPVRVDTLAPTVVEISGVPTTEQNAPFDITVTFSEPMKDFTAEDVTVNGPAAATAVSANAEKSAYTVTITPNATSEGDVTFQIAADVATDNAGNNNTASAVTNPVHIDTIAPTATITGLPTLERSIPFRITVTFSEPMKDFTVDDVTINGKVTMVAEILYANADKSAYTLRCAPNMMPRSEGDITFQVKADVATDHAGNGNTASAVTKAVHIDTLFPTPTITGVPTTEQSTPFDITITFDEEVSGFTVPDHLDVTGEATASLKATVTPNRVYTVTITPNPNQEGDVTVEVLDNKVMDTARNRNASSAVTNPVHIDTIVPTATITGVPTTAQSTAFDITVTFDEEVDGFSVAHDLAVTGPATASLKATVTPNEAFTVAITPNPNQEGDVTVQVKANAITDAAGNNNTASAVTNPVHIDTLAPTPTITGVPTEIQLAPFSVRIEFLEDVTGFELTDIALTGDAVVENAVLTPESGKAWTLTITPHEDTDGNVIITVPADVVQDVVLHNNVASSSQTVPVAPAWIPDPNLRIALRVGLGLAEGEDFSQSQLSALTGFTGASLAISDLTGLEHAIDLTRLDLNDNDITLVDALEDMTDLTVLTLKGNNIVDLTPLDGLTKLQTLDLRENAVVDVTPIATLTELTELSLANNQIQDVSPLVTLTKLVTLRVAGNPIKDLKPLIGLARNIDVTLPSVVADAGLKGALQNLLEIDFTEQVKEADLQNLTTFFAKESEITSLKGLEKATKLTTLDLSDNSITDITRLQHLTELTVLNLNGNNITDITPLAGLTKLTGLGLSDNDITDITPLEDLTNLMRLGLNDNDITDITPLEDLTDLTDLGLNSNPIDSLVPVASLTSLTLLSLDGNALSDLSALSGLTELQRLHLNDNAITSSGLNAITGLTALTFLDLSKNKVTGLTAVANFTQLIALNLSDNDITDVSPLTALTALEALYLDGNAIVKVQPLAGLANLEFLLLADNPILNTAPLYPLTQRVPPVDIDITVAQYPPWDVNEDGKVDAADSALVTAALGQSGAGIANSRTDVNGDGTVDNADLLLVTQNLDNNPGAAPAAMDTFALLDPESLAGLDRASLKATLDRLILESDGSQKYLHAIKLLQSVLSQLTPEETRLFANYPNPFNPETWIPYQLAKGSDVEIFIYDARGVLVRHLALGHQHAGYYTEKSRAAYWDGRNTVGERVASGIYFYRLQAENTSLLRKMLILK